MRMLAHAETILSHTEHTRKRFHRTLSIRGTNFCACSASGKMWTVFTCKFMLSIRETNLIAGWAYAERISSLAEHARKCLKVEYLGRIEYDFQKSRVTGSWDHKVSVSAKKFKKIFHTCVPLNKAKMHTFPHGSQGLKIWMPPWLSTVHCVQWC
jgi:hypothetical protein